MKKILFHHPLPLHPNAKSASGIRPQRMLQAFKELGYQVDLVTGYAKERKGAIRKIKKNIKNGVKYAFMYAESSTMPTTLTEKHHLPTHPLMDWLFFRLCKQHKITIGLFYRDIYWLFDEYGEGLSPLKMMVAKQAYRFDLWVYERTLTKLYLPSMEMAKVIPDISSTKFVALPPGHTLPKIEPKKQKLPLKLFYVGGLSSYYQMHKLFKALVGFTNVNLTICTRKEEWINVKNEYPNLPENIKIIHKSGDAMEQELLASDIAMLFVYPHKYRSLTVPFKLYEYLGVQKPIIASRGTLAAKFVEENNIGWSIEYAEDALIALLNNLIENPNLIEDVKKNIQKITPKHSWRVRAQQVIRELS